MSLEASVLMLTELKRDNGNLDKRMDFFFVKIIYIGGPLSVNIFQDLEKCLLLNFTHHLRLSTSKVGKFWPLT